MRVHYMGYILVGVKASVCEARFKKSRSSEARWFFEQKSEAKTGFYCH